MQTETPPTIDADVTVLEDTHPPADVPASPPAVPPGTELAAGIGSSPLDRLSPDELDALVSRQEKVADTVRRLMMVAVKLTQAHDWQDFDGNPYLEGEGAFRLCGPMGIELAEPRFRVTVASGHYFVECILKATWLRSGHSITEIGSRNTLDKFLVGDDPNRRTVYNQYLDTAGGDHSVARLMIVSWLKKAAYMNAVSRAVSAVLGLRGLKWPDLESMGLSKADAGAAIAFRKGESGKQRQTRRTEKAKAPEFHPILEVKAMAEGSRTATRGRLVGPPSVKGKRQLWSITEGGAGIVVTVWVEDAVPKWAVGNAALYVRNLRVGTYQGQTQYNSDDLPEEWTEAGQNGGAENGGGA